MKQIDMLADQIRQMPQDKLEALRGWLMTQGENSHKEVNK